LGWSRSADAAAGAVWKEEAAMSAGTYTLAEFVGGLRAITAELQNPCEITERVATLARALALAPTWLESKHYVGDAEQGFGIHVLHEEPDHTLLVFAAAWLPGRGAPPHNHGTWAVVAGVEGLERNTLWSRLDDGARPGYAEIRKSSETVVGPGDVLVFMPESIHSVVNESAQVTVSLHVYGYNLNLTKRSEFDPKHNAERPVLLKMQS
jgi:predicted metal-dependent enzyme (double-stranded beta helix superfamily)